MAFIQTLKAEWKAAAYTAPQDDEELALEEELGRTLIEEVTFPTEHDFYKMMQDWCLRASLSDLETSEVWARALKEHHELVYTSVAKLFYASLTDAYKTKARRIGQELDAEGGMPLMQLVYYGISHATKMVADELPGSDSDKMRAIASVYYMVSVAFDGVGEWLN